MIPGGLNMQARKVPAEHGWEWIKSGFGLFRLNPVIWIALFFVYLLLCLLLSSSLVDRARRRPPATSMP